MDADDPQRPADALHRDQAPPGHAPGRPARPPARPSHRRRPRRAPPGARTPRQLPPVGSRPCPHRRDRRPRVLRRQPPRQGDEAEQEDRRAGSRADTPGTERRRRPDPHHAQARHPAAVGAALRGTRLRPGPGSHGAPRREHRPAVLAAAPARRRRTRRAARPQRLPALRPGDGTCPGLPLALRVGRRPPDPGRASVVGRADRPRPAAPRWPVGGQPFPPRCSPAGHERAGGQPVLPRPARPPRRGQLFDGGRAR